MEQGRVHQCQCPECRSTKTNSSTKVLHEKMNILVSTLDERQRRLYAGLESKKLGHGGDRQVSLITGLNVDTIARGRRELDEPELLGRIRKTGGGRPAVEKKRPRHRIRTRTTARRLYGRFGGLEARFRKLWILRKIGELRQQRNIRRVKSHW